MAWAIYDDQAGSEIVTELIKKHTDGVKVRVLVDGQTVHRLRSRAKRACSLTRTWYRGHLL